MISSLFCCCCLWSVRLLAGLFVSFASFIRSIVYSFVRSFIHFARLKTVGNLQSLHKFQCLHWNSIKLNIIEAHFILNSPQWNSHFVSVCDIFILCISCAKLHDGVLCVCVYSIEYAFLQQFLFLNARFYFAFLPFRFRLKMHSTDKYIFFIIRI